jgi:hypothetical protein
MSFVLKFALCLGIGYASTACGVETPVPLVPAPKAEFACNGAAALCDRRYDEVVYLTAHNAMSHADAFWFAPNQNHDIARQLEDGVRGLSLDLFENPANAHEPLLCHGVCIGGSALFGAALRTLRYFLEANPHEVVTILYEGSVDDAAVVDTLEQMGLGAYIHTQAEDGPWPTLRTMINAGKRLVVFSQDAGGSHPWLHRMGTYTWDTPYSYQHVEEFDCSVGRGSADNGIFQINHFLTAPLAGEILAREANRYDVLMPRVQRCHAETGRWPTFLWVDWYATGDALRVVAELNGVH